MAGSEYGEKADGNGGGQWGGAGDGSPVGTVAPDGDRGVLVALSSRVVRVRDIYADDGGDYFLGNWDIGGGNTIGNHPVDIGARGKRD